MSDDEIIGNLATAEAEGQEGGRVSGDWIVVLVRARLGSDYPEIRTITFKLYGGSLEEAVATARKAFPFTLSETAWELREASIEP